MTDSFMWQIMVPCEFNSGKPVRTRHHQQWDKRVRAITGGLTILPPGLGQWVSPTGEIFRERMIPVQVMASREQILKIVEFTLEHYRQQAVSYFRISDSATIAHATPEQIEKFNVIDKRSNA